jgi:hypothetical protein
LTHFFEHDENVGIVLHLVHPIDKASFLIVVSGLFDLQQLCKRQCTGSTRRRQDTTNGLTFLNGFGVLGFGHDSGVDSDGHCEAV